VSKKKKKTWLTISHKICQVCYFFDSGLRICVVFLWIFLVWKFENGFSHFVVLVPFVLQILNLSVPPRKTKKRRRLRKYSCMCQEKHGRIGNTRKRLGFGTGFQEWIY
jgi:hypothetical protein